MAEDTIIASESETQDDAIPQGETPATSESSETQDATTDRSTAISAEDAQREIERLKSALKKANTEAATHRHKAKELDDLRAKQEAEKLSETERLLKQYADLQRTYDDAQRQSQERIINYEVRLRAAQMGIVDPDVAAKLLDWSGIEYDDNGSPSNVNELLRDLVKSKPYLASKAPQPTSGGATNPARSQSSATEITAANVSQFMTPDKYSKLSPEQKKQVTQILANTSRFGGRAAR